MFRNLDFFRAQSLLLATGNDQKVYCLADHAGIAGLLKQLKRSGTAWASLFDGTKEENAQAVAPLLFQVCAAAKTAEGRCLLDWVSKHGTYSSSLLLLASPLGFEALFQRLVHRLDAKISDDMNVLLRYFDPRVFEQLLHVFSAEQKRDFLSIAGSWGIVDRRGELQIIRSEFSDVDPIEDPTILSAAQEFALLDASEADQVAEQLRKNMPNHFSQVPLPFRHDFILKSLRDAKTYGIEAMHEKSLFCAVALMYGDGFAHTDQWNALLKRVREGSATFYEVVSAVDLGSQEE